MPNTRPCPACQHRTPQVRYADAGDDDDDTYYHCRVCRRCWYQCRVHGTFTAHQRPSPENACTCWEKPDPRERRRFKVTVKVATYAVCYVQSPSWAQAKALVEQQLADDGGASLGLEMDDVQLEDAEVIFVDSEDGQDTFYEV